MVDACGLAGVEMTSVAAERLGPRLDPMPYGDVEAILADAVRASIERGALR